MRPHGANSEPERERGARPERRVRTRSASPRSVGRAATYGHVVPSTATNGSMSANVTVPLPLQSAFSQGQVGWF